MDKLLFDLEKQEGRDLQSCIVELYNKTNEVIDEVNLITETQYEMLKSLNYLYIQLYKRNLLGE